MWENKQKQKSYSTSRVMIVLLYSILFENEKSQIIEDNLFKAFHVLTYFRITVVLKHLKVQISLKILLMKQFINIEVKIFESKF